MDPLPSIHQHENDDVFTDALHHSSAEEPPEASSSASTLTDSKPIFPEPRDSHSNQSSPATTLRRRSIRLGSKQPSYSSTDIDSINVTRRSFKNHPRYKNLKQDENSTAKPYSDEPHQVNALPASIPATEVNNEESTATTAMNDDSAGDSADSALRLGDSSFLELIAGLVIKALGFQIKLIFMFITYPLQFTFRSCLFFMDPFGTTKMGKDIFVLVLCNIWSIVIGYIKPYVRKWFKGNESIWSVMFRFGLGFLWAIYVCCMLIGLLVSSFVFSGFLMKCFVEKPIQIKESLNFDYTKLSPVAYVPIISCDGVVSGKDSGKLMMGERVIPSKHKVQVTVSLRVPESGYNRNLGVFQVLAYFYLVHFRVNTNRIWLANCHEILCKFSFTLLFCFAS